MSEIEEFYVSHWNRIYRRTGGKISVHDKDRYGLSIDQTIYEHSDEWYAKRMFHMMKDLYNFGKLDKEKEIRHALGIKDRI